MVAYSFNRQFYDAVSAGTKKQTVRANRRRHARPGEPVQLYAAMRTKHCRKLVDPDPIVSGISLIEIEITSDLTQRLASLSIDGLALNDEQIEAFAVADGFAATSHTSARQRMGRFWSINHGEGRFEGVLIKWEAKA